MVNPLLALPLIGAITENPKKQESEMSEVQLKPKKITRLTYPFTEVTPSSLSTFNFEIGMFRRIVSFMIEPQSAMPKTRVGVKFGIFKEPATFIYSKTGMISQIGATGKQRQHFTKVVDMDVPTENLDITINVLNGKVDTIDFKVNLLVEEL